MIRQVVKANLILIVQYAVGSLIPLLLMPHIVRVIGLAEYGHLAILMAWGGYGALIVQYAFQLTGPKRVMHLAPCETSSSVFADIAYAKLILLSIVLLVMAIFSFIFKPFESTSAFAWILLFTMPIAAGFNSSWFLQAKGHFLHVCILSIIGSLLTLYIGFNYIHRGNSNAIYFSVVVSVFGAMFIGVSTFLLAISSTKKERHSWRTMKAIDAIKEGRHLFISQFISMLYTASGPIIINYLMNAKAAGAYSVTERVINALLAAALLTHTAAYPNLASAYKNNRSGYWRMLKLILTGYLCVSLIISVYIWSYRDLVARFIFGEINSEHYSLLFFGLVWFVFGIFGTALTGYLTVSERSGEVWRLTLKILLFSVALGIPGVMFFGGAGWLAALVASQLFVLQSGYKLWRREDGE